MHGVPDLHVDGLPRHRSRVERNPRRSAASLHSTRSLLSQARGGAGPLVQETSGAWADDCRYSGCTFRPFTDYNQHLLWYLLSRQGNAVLRRQFDDNVAS